VLAKAANFQRMRLQMAVALVVAITTLYRSFNIRLKAIVSANSQSSPYNVLYLLRQSRAVSTTVFAVLDSHAFPMVYRLGQLPGLLAQTGHALECGVAVRKSAIESVHQLNKRGERLNLHAILIRYHVKLSLLVQSLISGAT
jgi:hypothetical protein